MPVHAGVKWDHHTGVCLGNSLILSHNFTPASRSPSALPTAIPPSQLITAQLLPSPEVTIIKYVGAPAEWVREIEGEKNQPYTTTRDRGDAPIEQYARDALDSGRREQFEHGVMLRILNAMRAIPASERKIIIKKSRTKELGDH